MPQIGESGIDFAPCLVEGACARAAGWVGERTNSWLHYAAIQWATEQRQRRRLTDGACTVGPSHPVWVKVFKASTRAAKAAGGRIEVIDKEDGLWKSKLDCMIEHGQGARTSRLFP